MTIEGATWHPRAEAVGPSEKIHMRRRLPRPVSGTAESASAYSPAKDPENMSRFGTRRIVVLPASAFAAQILGQALGGNRPDLHDVADAYAHAAQAKLPPFLVPRGTV